MPLKLRPTGLGHGVYKDNVDYGVFSGEWCIGRIYETRTGPADLRWFWALHAPSKPGHLRIAIALLADTAEPVLAPARVLLRHEPDPG